jgi:hypothetical protein
MTDQNQRSGAARDFGEIKRALAIIVSVLIVLGVLVLCIVAYNNRDVPELADDVRRNFPVIFGMPLSAAVAFLVVTVFKQKDADMKVKVLELELSGSSGEVLLWTVIFAVSCLMLHLLWVPPKQTPRDKTGYRPPPVTLAARVDML